MPTSVPGYSDVKVSWASGNGSIIAADGTVTHQAGTGADTVPLTATLALDTLSDTKAFSVTVYQKDKVLTADEVLTAAKAKLTTITNTDKYYPDGVTLDTSLSVDGKTVTVSWAEPKDSAHFVLSGNILTIARDIVDVSDTLTATLSYDGKTATKDVTATAAHIPEVTLSYTSGSRTYAFTGTTLKCTEARDGKVTDGTQYSYTADTTKKQITVTTTAVYDEGTGKWLNKSEYTKKREDDISEMYNEIIMPLVNNPTMEQLIELMGGADNEEYAYTSLVEFGCFGDDVTTVEQAKAKTTEEKNAAVKAYVEVIRKQNAASLGLSENASWSDIKASSVASSVSSVFISDTYEYDIYDTHSSNDSSDAESVSFSTTGVYNTSKKWYEQRGNWYANVDDTSYSLDIYSAESRTGGIQSGVYASGTFDASFSTFTAVADAGGTVWKIDSGKAASDKTITITNTSTNTSVTLAFYGYSL